MPSIVQQLENNEAVLLMYAADELPPEDRAEVEQMLANDAGMRAELDTIRVSLAAVEDAMGDLDSITRLPMSSAVAVRRLTPALADWQHQRLAPMPSATLPANRRFAWWVYPAATAAAVLLAAVVWWGVRGDDVNVGTSFAVQSDNLPSGPDQLADRGHGSGDGQSFHNFGGPPGSSGPGMMPLDAPDAELSDAEQQVATLTRRGDDQASTSSIFMTDSQTD